MATPVIMPRQGQSVETCILAQWYKKKGDLVNKGEIILSYETDKAAFELEAPVSGTILEIFYQDGEEVKVLSNITVIGQPGESVDEFKPGESSLTTESSKKLSDSDITFKTDTGKQIGNNTTEYFSEPDQIKISPRARKLADRLNVPLSRIRGTGPDGRIIERDIENAAATLRTTPLASEIMEKEGKAYGDMPTGPGGRFKAADLVTRTHTPADEFVIKKISNIRRIIAENMRASLKNSAQ